MGICGEMICAELFDGLLVLMMLVGLGFNNVFGFIGGDSVACVSKYLDSAYLPHGSL